MPKPIPSIWSHLEEQQKDFQNLFRFSDLTILANEKLENSYIKLLNKVNIELKEEHPLLDSKPHRNKRKWQSQPNSHINIIYIFRIVCCICYYSNLVAIFYIGFRLWVCLWHFKSVGAIFSVNLAVYISKMRYYVHYLHFSDYCPDLCRHVYHNVSAVIHSDFLP